MARKILYQTLTDRNNPDVVLSEGPFICTSDDAWLGHGFYFWDTFEPLAHWWGTNKLQVPYIICKAQCDFSAKVCFDMQGETEHMALFFSIAKVMEQEGLIDEDTTVAEVFYYIKQKLGIFHWKAIRVSGVLSVSLKLSPEYVFRMHFTKTGKQFLDLMPPIQLCIFDLQALDFKNLEIIHPEQYKLAI